MNLTESPHSPHCSIAYCHLRSFATCLIIIYVPCIRLIHPPMYPSLYPSIILVPCSLHASTFLNMFLDIFHSQQLFRSPHFFRLVGSADAASFSGSVEYICFENQNQVKLLRASGTIAKQPSNGPECLGALQQTCRTFHGFT